MQIEAGKRYIRRDGQTTAPMVMVHDGGRHPFFDPSTCMAYCSNGRYWSDQESKSDLIEEFSPSQDQFSDFYGVKIGDSIWTIQGGWTEVKQLYTAGFRTTDNNYYTFEGKRLKEDAASSAFWDEPKFKLPPKPKRMITKTIEVWAVVSKTGAAENAFSDEKVALNWSFPRNYDCIKCTGTYEMEEEDENRDM